MLIAVDNKYHTNKNKMPELKEVLIRKVAEAIEQTSTKIANGVYLFFNVFSYLYTDAIKKYFPLS